MTNTEELTQVIKDSGLKKSTIASKLGLSRYGFMRKVNGVSEFTVSEMDELCRILNIKQSQRNRIFFAA